MKDLTVVVPLYNYDDFKKNKNYLMNCIKLKNYLFM